MASSSRAFDLVILGATGFTGQFVARYVQKNCPTLRWAIAGRNSEKLSSFANELTKVKSTQPPPKILVADTNDKPSLVEAFKNAKVVINCTGPYRFLGEPVVDACIAAGSDYMDIAGEPQFMESSFLKYHKKAVENNVLILHSCAFDSVPADLGVLHALRQFPPGCCAKVDSFIDIHAKLGFQAHVTTYDCAVHGFGDADNLRNVRKEISKQFKIPKIQYLGAKLPKSKPEHSSDYFEKRIGKHVVPFMGADVSVVRSSQRSMAMATGETVWPLYSHYAAVTNLATVIRYRNMFGTLAQHPLGRQILLKFPEFFSGGIFSHQGPTEEQVNNTTFDFHIFADGYSSQSKRDSSPGINDSRGWACVSNSHYMLLDSSVLPEPDVSRHFVLSGPEPFYQSTPNLLVPLSISLLEERSSMPKGGVYTPAAAYCNSPGVFKRLAESGMEFRDVK
jgi:short subunit dehydrogenase-like uncharacterized protein